MLNIPCFFMMFPLSKFTVSYQNIGGMHAGRRCEANEISETLSCDIVVLSEVWGCNCQINFENYSSYRILAQKHEGRKKGRKSGGFFILITN